MDFTQFQSDIQMLGYIWLAILIGVPLVILIHMAFKGRI